MNNALIEKENIENMIYEVRGVQVMLDSDLAKLYQCKNGTKEINQAVRNNPEKFPERFCFRITEAEMNNLKSKILTSSYGGSRKGHNVFTEQGVAMLATILKTSVATKVTINIMDTFVYMRRYISQSLIEQKYINNMVLENREEIKLIKETFNKLSEKKKVNTIFYKGEIFDAYVLLMEILESAKEEIIIIDDYAGKELFKILKDIEKRIIVITSNIDEIAKKKYENQYHNIEIRQDDSFHDRFIIIDKKVLYHSGASFKDLGSKCFAINLVQEKDVTQKLLSKIK